MLPYSRSFVHWQSQMLKDPLNLLYIFTQPVDLPEV